MGFSVVEIQREIILQTIRRTTNGEWKVLVVDELARDLVENVVTEDDILNENITHIEQLENKRPSNRDTNAIYILTPQPYVVDCFLADIERRRYRRSHLIWTAYLDPPLRKRIDSEPKAREHISSFEILSINFFPRESHLVLFREPWSFPILFHPACNNLVRSHMLDLAQKVVCLCLSLGEYPTIRYYRPPAPSHEASVLCTHLARFIQDELDTYAQYNPDFPPHSSRPGAVMYITDRSMDLYTPIVHEFTYQAMAHDLLPIKEGKKVMYKTTINAGEPNQVEKEMEIGEKDKIWVENRHRHMKDTIEKLMGDFRKFIEDHPHFAESDGDKATSLNAIKDMLAGLPQFQELKQAYALHLSMAQECMNIFEQHKLADIASVEQSLATALDEDYRKPKNLADQVVRLLDDDSVVSADRLRLIILYLLYRDGLVPTDTQRLLAHAQLGRLEGDIIQNLELLGAKVNKSLKENKSNSSSSSNKQQTQPDSRDGYALSRFNPGLKSVLEQHINGTLDPTIFPFTKPPATSVENSASRTSLVSQASLRSAKPTWAKSRSASTEPRQRILVVMAGGATYSEARACYEVSNSSSKEAVLITSHMLTPGLFLRQVGDLGVDRRRLDLPPDQPPRQIPRHLLEPEPQLNKAIPAAPAPPAKSPGPTPPTNALASMKLQPAGAQGPVNGHAHQPSSSNSMKPQFLGGKEADKKKDKDEKKKKHHFFSSKK